MMIYIILVSIANVFLLLYALYLIRGKADEKHSHGVTSVPTFNEIKKYYYDTYSVGYEKGFTASVSGSDEFVRKSELKDVARHDELFYIYFSDWPGDDDHKIYHNELFELILEHLKLKIRHVEDTPDRDELVSVKKQPKVRGKK